MSEQINKVEEVWIPMRDSTRMSHIVAISNLMDYQVKCRKGD